ncbi:MAG: hypothetical protein ACRDM1_03715 [Gaiellaceae bacterium]
MKAGGDGGDARRGDARVGSEPPGERKRVDAVSPTAEHEIFVWSDYI